MEQSDLWVRRPVPGMRDVDVLTDGTPGHWILEDRSGEVLALLMSPNEQDMTALLAAAAEVVSHRASRYNLSLSWRSVSEVLQNPEECAQWIEGASPSEAARLLTSFAIDCAQDPIGPRIWSDFTDRANALDGTPNGQQMLADATARAARP